MPLAPSGYGGPQSGFNLPFQQQMGPSPSSAPSPDNGYLQQQYAPQQRPGVPPANRNSDLHHNRPVDCKPNPGPRSQLPPPLRPGSSYTIQPHPQRQHQLPHHRNQQPPSQDRHAPTAPFADRSSLEYRLADAERRFEEERRRRIRAEDERDAAVKKLATYDHTSGSLSQPHLGGLPSQPYNVPRLATHINTDNPPHGGQPGYNTGQGTFGPTPSRNLDLGHRLTRRSVREASASNGRDDPASTSEDEHAGHRSKRVKRERSP